MGTWLLSKPMAILGLLAICLIALAVVSRNWSCKTPRKPRDRSVTITGICTAVLSGNRIEVTPDRRRLVGSAESEPVETIPPEARRPQEYRLAGVIVDDPGTTHGDASKTLLESLLLEKDVRVELDGRREQEGVVYAPTGACCQIEMLSKGLARIGQTSNAEWVQYERVAKASHLGIWGK